MNGPFAASRLANLRQKRPSGTQNPISIKQQQKPLVLQLDQESGYQPSIANQAGRTATRFLMGRIERKPTIEKPNAQGLGSNNDISGKQSSYEPKQLLKLSQPQTGDLRLVLNDSPQFTNKKQEVKIAPQQPLQKRVLIQKKQEKQQIKPQPKPEVKQEVKPVQKINPKVQEQPIQVKNPQSQKINEEEVQESKQGQNQNELVECPEGCGRKFNRKALEKHAKACKLVFMSKRKQFNSEAKRLTSQEQAAIVKQNKLQEKKAQMGMTKGKGFQKTGQNWKAASEDFRSAIKAIKKQGVEGEEQTKQEMKVAVCEHCEKQMVEVLLAKHLQNCVKKKQKELKEKKKATKKK